MDNTIFTIDVSELKSFGEITLTSQGREIVGTYRIEGGKGRGVVVTANDFDEITDDEAQEAVEKAENLYWNGTNEIAWSELKP